MQSTEPAELNEMVAAAFALAAQDKRPRALHAGAFGSIKQPCKAKATADERKAKRRAQKAARRQQRAK